MIATLTSNAQITLPKVIRGTLGLHPDDKVDFAPQPDGRITVSKARRAGKHHLPPCAGCYCSLSGLTALQK